MQLFNYRAVDLTGKTMRSSIIARDAADVKRKLQENGLVPVKISQSSSIQQRMKEKLVKKANTKAVSLFCRQLYIIINSGVNILNGLDILRNQTKNKVMKEVVGKMFSEVQKGNSMSEAMKAMENVLPPLLVNMVSVGEVSGNLDDILKRMSAYYEKESFMKDKLVSAVIYPVMLLCIGLGIMLIFLYFVLPSMVGMLKDLNVELPPITKAVIAGSDYIKKYMLFYIAGIAAVIIAVRTLTPKEAYRLVKDKFIMRLPVINVSVKNVVTSRFLRTVSLMLKGGIPLLYVLESAERVMGNSIAESGIRSAIEGVKRGERLGENIASCGYFDPMVVHMINVGEETGELDNIMDTMADFYDREAEAWLAKTMAMIEPAFIIVIGALIALLLASMMLPMFSMISQLNIGA